MPIIPRTDALQLASTAREMGGEAIRGVLEQNAEGRWTVGHIEVESWLSRLKGMEVLLTLAALDAETPQTYKRTCRTCGNEYEGRTCPHCEAVRRRFRG